MQDGSIDPINNKAASNSRNSQVRASGDIWSSDCAPILQRMEQRLRMEMSNTFGTVLNHQDIEVFMEGFKAQLSNVLLK